MADDKKKVKRPEGPPSKLLQVTLGDVKVSTEEDEDEDEA